MTDFQISLIAASGTLIVGIFVYNKWQEYKAKKTVENAFADGDDVLLNPELPQVVSRQEPVFNDAPGADSDSDGRHNDTALHSGQPADADHLQTGESAFAQQPAEPAADGEAVTELKLPVASAARDLPVDELIDCVIPLEFDTPVRGDKILAEISELKFVGKKPVHFIGLDDQGEKNLIAVGGAYTTVFAGIQMVGRSGPLSELEYSEFIMKLRAIADNLSGYPDIPDMHKIIGQARELHQFVAEHDAKLSVNVITTGAPWALNTLMAALEKMGFDQRPDGHLMMPDGDGGSLFSLSTNAAVSEATTGKLTLLLDVPCVSPARNAFAAMAACAKSLATRLGGAVVDDGHRGISKEALDEIALQVNEFYAAMEEAQIPAGSVRAQRLFS